MESLWALSSVLEGVSACFNDLLLEIALPPNTFRAVGGQVVIVHKLRMFTIYQGMETEVVVGK